MDHTIPLSIQSVAPNTSKATEGSFKIYPLSAKMNFKANLRKGKRFS